MLRLTKKGKVLAYLICASTVLLVVGYAKNYTDSLSEKNALNVLRNCVSEMVRLQILLPRKPTRQDVPYQSIRTHFQVTDVGNLPEVRRSSELMDKFTLQLRERGWVLVVPSTTITKPIERYGRSEEFLRAVSTSGGKQMSLNRWGRRL